MIETMRRSVRGVELFERRIGTGTPSVVLHGGPGAHHDYLLPGFDLLAQRRLLIYYDQRGGGQSPVPRDVPVGWEEQVEDLEALRSLWGLETLSLAGYSWGGLLGLLYATRYPERVSHLALVSHAPVWRAARAEFEARFAERNLDPKLQQERKQLRESGLREQDPEAYRQRVFELSVVAYFCDPLKVRDMTPFRVTGRTIEEVWQSLGDYDLRPAIERLTLPAIVLHGDCDPIPAATAETTARLLRAPFHLIRGAGHVPYVEAPEEFASLLNGFLPA
jgi:proline iminopeptidase